MPTTSDYTEGHTVRAFDAECTHLTCIVKWSGESDGFKCDCHGGAFSRDGAKVAGPPSGPLAEYEVADPATRDGQVVVLDKKVPKAQA